MAKVIEEIDKRLSELVTEGDRLIETYGARNCASSTERGWFAAVANVVEMITGGRGPYHDAVRGTLGTLPMDPMSGSIRIDAVRAVVGILRSLQEDWSRGLVTRVEYLIAAADFDDFLDHAKAYHKGNKSREAGVLLSAVFEDAIRKLAAKHNVDVDAKVDAIIDGLSQRGVVTAVAGKRLKAAAGLRNKVDHAKWDEFTIQDVGESIRTVEQLIELLQA